MDACESLPTLTFDVFIDSWFISDVLLNFFMAVYLHSGAYENRPKVVAFRYVFHGTFFFDLLTTTPVGLFELLMLRDCSADESAGYSVLSVR